MSKESRTTPSTTGTAEQLDRIERKLDALLDALAEEGEDQEDGDIEVRGLDGSTTTVPRRQNYWL